MEQTTSNWITPQYESTMRRARCIWDFSPANVEHWQAKGLVTAYVPLPLVAETLRDTKRRYQEHPLAAFSSDSFPAPTDATATEALESAIAEWDKARPVDVLFYGAPNHRRARIRNQLQEAAEGKDLRIVFSMRYDLFGERREREIIRAKVVLNLHYYEGASLEVHRIHHLLAHGKAIVSERSADPQLDETYEKRGAVFFASEESLVADVLALLEDAITRLRLEQNSLGLAQELAWDTELLETGLELARTR
eukprot:scaffold1790_cov257-Pinguiococcus_pyrenoidosus.AAC.30